MGLQLSEIADDPLVKQTLKVYGDAFAEDAGGDAVDPLPVPPLEDMPGVKVLVDCDALDSVSAAVFAIGPMSQLIPVEMVEAKLDPRVAATLRLLNESVEDGPEQLLATNNPHILKLLTATVAGSMDQEALREMAGTYASDLKSAVTDISDFVLLIGEHLAEDGRVKEIPPKLMDKFLDGIDNLAEVSPSRTHKRVLAEISRELKAEVMKAAAAEVTAPSAAPQIDPESKFEQLKNSARKFKPGGMNG